MDIESTRDDGVVHMCALAEAVDFIFVTIEVERVCGEQTGIGFFETAGIGDEEDAIHGVQKEMKAARWADLEILFELDGVNHGSAVWAL